MISQQQDAPTNIADTPPFEILDFHHVCAGESARNFENNGGASQIGRLCKRLLPWLVDKRIQLRLAHNLIT
jgi:hypothetical protein